MTSKSKGKTIKDQIIKLAVIFDHLDITMNKQAASMFGVKESTITGWRKGNNISYTSLDVIASKLCVTKDDLDMEINEFCNLLGRELPSNDQTIWPSSLFNNRDINFNDINLMRSIVGEYCLLYLCRIHEKGDEVDYIRVQKISIGPFSDDKNVLKAEQIKNVVTGTNSVGWARCIDNRIILAFDYEEYYPESLFNLMPFKLRNNLYYLYGIYLDIDGPPIKEIFSVRALFVPRNDWIWQIDKITPDMSCYTPIRDLVEDGGLRNRKRMSVTSDRDTVALLRSAMDKIEKGG